MSKARSAFTGALVRISGQVVELSSGAMVLDDGSGKVRVFVSSTAPFKRPAARRGQRSSNPKPDTTIPSP